MQEWWDRIHAWQAQYPLSFEPSMTGEIKPQELLKAICKVSGGDAILCSDVGQHQMWAAQYYDFPAPRRWINSGGLGTMGFGLPAAIGAQLGEPDRLTVVISGDGSIQMNIQELATVRQEKLPIKIVVMNNGSLGMVRQWQELFWNERYSHVDMNTRGGEAAFPDFVKLADAYGIRGARLTDPLTLEDDLRAAFEAEGPAFIDVHVAQGENVYPMIAPGEAARNMVG